MHLCPNDWIALTVLIFVFFSSWLFGSQNDGNFYRIYEKARASTVIAPARGWFAAIWFILYVLLVIAVFLFYFHDDTCRCRSLDDVGSEIFSDDDDEGSGSGGPPPLCLESEMSIGLQTATWVLIIVNIILNKLWDVIVAKASVVRANVAFAQVLFTMLTAVCVTVLLFVVASRTDSVVYFSAVVYALYSIWLIIATALTWTMVANFNTYARYDEEKKTWVVVDKRLLRR